MSDLILRQAAIDAVMECYDNDELFEVYEDRLNALPSAQPMRKKGKWIDGSIPTYAVCSECGYQERYAYENNFCPNCGCQMMRGDAE